jgi:hypothetical protein
MRKPVKKLKTNLISFNQTDFQNLEKLAKSRSMTSEEFADYLSQLLNRKYSTSDFLLKGSKPQMYNFFMRVKDNVLEQIRLDQTRLQENVNRQKQEKETEKKRIEDDAERQRLENERKLQEKYDSLVTERDHLVDVQNSLGQLKYNELKSLAGKLNRQHGTKLKVNDKGIVLLGAINIALTKIIKDLNDEINAM